MAAQVGGGLAILTTIGLFIGAILRSELTFLVATILEFALAGGIVGLFLARTRSGPWLAAGLVAIAFITMVGEGPGLLYLPPLLLLLWSGFKAGPVKALHGRRSVRAPIA